MIVIDMPTVDVSRVSRELGGNSAHAVQAIMVAIYLWANRVATLAMRKTPVDTGYLRRSRYVTKPQMSGTRFNLEVGFYALYADAVHNGRRTSRGNRIQGRAFLRDAYNELYPGAASFISRNANALAQQGGASLSGVPEVHPTMALIGPQIHPRALRNRQRRIKKEHRAAERARRSQERAAAAATKRTAKGAGKGRKR